MLGIMLVDDVDDSSLCSEVGRTDEIVMTFLFNGELVALFKISSQDGTCAPRRHYRYVQ